MSPSVTYSRQDIIQSTFEIYKEVGFEHITARKIAAKMGCSVVPIYSNFKSMEELKRCIMDKTLQVLLEYVNRQYSPHPFLNIGLGILAFAKDYKELYKTIFVNSNQYAYLMDELFEKNLELMQKDDMLKTLSVLELKRTLEKIRLFTHGLAVFICSGNMEGKTEEDILGLLKEAGEDMIGYLLHKKNKGVKSNGF